MGTPRHLSQHPGGFVLTRDRLDELVPIEPAAMDNRQVIEWDKDDIDALKFMKVDCLALGMLSCMKRGFDLLKDHKGIDLDLATIPAEDPRTYAMIRKADTLGTFQIESRAQMVMLPRMKPRTFYDLVIEVAIVRPGPIQGDMVHPYLRRREGKEAVVYPKPELEKVLGKTLGVPLFQEQAMRVAIECAGFTATEADQLRRSMATFKMTGGVSHFRDKLVNGMVANGYERDFAERQLWLSGKPCRIVCPDCLCFLLAKMPPPGCLLRCIAQRPAYGVLRACADRARRHQSRDPGTAGMHQCFTLGLHFGADRYRGSFCR
jgi:error-prone DNA polymerase